MKQIFILLTLIILILSCKTQQSAQQPSKDYREITSLNYIDEIVIPNQEIFNDTRVGGLSGIDYKNGRWLAISDDRKLPRFYEFDLKYTDAGFTKAQVVGVTRLKDIKGRPFKAGKADPESLRVITTGHVLWSSEGNITKKIDPFIRIATITGDYTDSITISSRYKTNQVGIKGPRNNGVFESLTRDYDSNHFWAAIELPLEEDGDVPTFKQANSPIRLVFINMDDKAFSAEYAYDLEKVARKGEIEINGVTEILSYDSNTFLFIERSYSKGYADGGNAIKVYKVTIADATEISNIPSLSKTSYIPVTKELLLDFETIRSQLASGVVDNIEGMCFGPNFENGNRSLLFVSDNNFNAFGKQITQLLLFEVK